MRRPYDHRQIDEYSLLKLRWYGVRDTRILRQLDLQRYLTIPNRCRLVIVSAENQALFIQQSALDKGSKERGRVVERRGKLPSNLVHNFDE